jgi:hypothetical protein
MCGARLSSDFQLLLATGFHALLQPSINVYSLPHLNYNGAGRWKAASGSWK